MKSLRMNEDNLLEGITTDWVSVLSSNIDNMDGEMIGALMERFFTLGALDVSYTPIQMKKNRPATAITIICSFEHEKLLVNTLLRETSTLGVRVEQVQRYIAEREQQSIETPFGTVQMKVKRLAGQVVSARPEFEDCQRIAREKNIPLVDVQRVLISIAQQHFPTSIIEENSEKM